MKKPLILVDCEESQEVTKVFRNLGFNAFSCDTEECSGGYPEWHLKMDIFEAIKLRKWNMLIGFPPCTYLSSVQTFLCRKDELRVIKRIEAADFFMKLWTADIEFICLENPTGVMTHIFRPADQVIHPYFFGGDSMKRTCLWLKNLPKLKHYTVTDLFNTQTHGKVKPPVKTWIQKSSGKIKYQRDVNTPFLSSKERSKLSVYIAKSMAEQWKNVF